MNVLLGVAAYALTGYLVFRGWLRLCPPINGWYGNALSVDMVDGWFVPDFNGRTVRKYQKLDRQAVPAGMSIEACFWTSVLGWPGVVVLGMVGLACGAAQHIAEATIQLDRDKELTEAEHEVEQLLRDEESGDG